ncbi:hypothetical protein FRC06_005972 [Ceratobasidium sp. 370]|nr:hypothetical protein FRC06_005972 [Ceratobasidium sp. 370]
MADLAEVWLTVPASWNADACNLMREVALRAGLVWGNASPNGVDSKRKDRLKIISKAEAAAAHCAYFTDLRLLRSSQNFMICDAGGSTFDLAIYRVLGSLKNLEIGEAAFDETVKFSFGGEEDDRALFPFSCFNPEYPDDRSVGLVNGELDIPGMLLRSEVFDPVISGVLWFINDQIEKFGGDIDALLLVGRFAWSEHLFNRINEQFGTRIKIIARPPDTDTAACRGAARYGLENTTPMASYIAPRSYLMKVKLPAEPEDWRMRAGYITRDGKGKSVCNNRIQYLIQKGAVLKKGQMVKIMFRKFSKSIEDCVFEVQVFTSDSERTLRYTDEGETSELCKWTIDLSLLPSFKEHARVESRNGFYTEFELGLRLETNELRGVLLYDGEERGRVMSEPLNP